MNATKALFPFVEKSSKRLAPRFQVVEREPSHTRGLKRSIISAITASESGALALAARRVETIQLAVGRSTPQILSPQMRRSHSASPGLLAPREKRSITQHFHRVATRLTCFPH